MDHGNPLLIQATIYFAAAVIAVLVAQRLGLGSVAGYLLAGIAIGPFGLELVGEVQDIRAFAELGVVFLLFVIGLELEPRRLWSMRGRLLGLGVSQVLGCIAALALAAWALGVRYLVRASSHGFVLNRSLQDAAFYEEMRRRRILILAA